MKARVLFRPEQVQEQWSGDEEAHSLSVEPDPERMELDLRQPRERVVEVALEERVVEETEALDLRVHPVRVEVRVPELAETAESDVVHVRHGNRDGGDRQRIGNEPGQGGPPARGIPQLAPVERAVRGERFKDEEHGGQGERAAGDGGA